MPLAVGRAFDGDGHAFLEYVDAGPFEKRRHAAPAQAAAATRIGGARVEILPAGERGRLVEHQLELPAVVGLVHRVAVRHLLGANHVAPAKLDRIDAGLARRRVHQALDDVDRLRPTGAAIGAGRRGIRQHRADADVDRPDVVNAGRHPRADHQLDDDAGRRPAGADVGQRIDAQREDPAVAVQRELRLAADVAAVRRGQEFLDALGAPFERHPVFARAPGKHDVFRIDAGLHAEAAADIADQHPHLVGRNAEHDLAQVVAQPGRRLAADAQRDPLGRRVVAREHRARLDRTGDDALIDKIQRHAVRGPGEGGVGRRRVAVSRFARDVARSGGPELRRAGRHRSGGVDHRRQRIVAHVDRLDRIARLLCALRDHRGNGFADKAHGTDRQRMSRRRRRRRSVGALEVGRQRQRHDRIADQVLAGDDRDHARHAGGGPAVDGLDARVRMR